MVNAYEKGRKLIVELGEEGDDDFIRVTVKPLSAELGAALQALHAGIVFGQSEDLERDAVLMGKLAIGEENWDLVEDLRWSESEALIHAAFFWNVQGGGIDLVNTLLTESLGGYPKALSTLMKRAGLSTVFEQLRTLLSGDEGNEIPAPDGMNDTSTPDGSLS